MKLSWSCARIHASFFEGMLKDTNRVACLLSQWRIQDFPDGVRQPREGCVPTYYLTNFSRKLQWKWRNFGPEGGGGGLERSANVWFNGWPGSRLQWMSKYKTVPVVTELFNVVVKNFDTGKSPVFPGARCNPSHYKQDPENSITMFQTS